MSGLKSSYQHFILFYKCILNRKEKKSPTDSKETNTVMKSWNLLGGQSSMRSQKFFMTSNTLVEASRYIHAVTQNKQP